MKKLLGFTVLLGVIVIGAFFLLLSGTSPQDADPQPISITLEDNFER